MPEETKEKEQQLTMCAIIKYLYGVKEKLIAKGYRTVTKWDCEIDAQTDQITAIRYQRSGDFLTGINLDPHCVLDILDCDLSLDAYISKKGKIIYNLCCENEDMEIGNTSEIANILEEYNCRKDADGNYSKETVMNIMYKLLSDKVERCIVITDELCPKIIHDALTANHSNKLYILKSEENNPTRVFTNNDEIPQEEAYNADGKAKSQQEARDLFVEIDISRAVQILLLNNIKMKHKESWF